jgi:hypothetical protein
LTFLYLLAQLDQLVRLVRLDRRDPLVEQALQGLQDLVDLLVLMVVTEVTVLPDPLVVKDLLVLLARPGQLDLRDPLDHRVPLAVLHSSTTLAQLQQTATPVQVRYDLITLRKTPLPVST